MHSPPVWSIGKGKRSTDLNSSATAPGPGAYNSVDIPRRTSPGWRIGQANRSIDYRSETPGPGKYDTTTKVNRGPKCVIGGARQIIHRSETPGPGSYNVRILRATDIKPPSYSIRGRYTENPDPTATPGPGTYDQASRILHIRPASFKIGNAKRDEIYKADGLPGPGAYVSNPRGTLSGPKWGFGTAERAEMGDTSKSVVGPGAYKLNSSFEEKSRGAILLSRRPDSAIFDSAKVPGPGAYTVGLFAKKRAPSYKLGTAPRSSISKEATLIPGPGQYTLSPERHRNSVIIGSSSRKPLNDKIDTPGPGAYSFDMSTNKGPKYGMIPRRDEVLKVQKDRETPGPGAYDPAMDAVKTKMPKYGIGNGAKDSIYTNPDGPGPGMYDTRGRLNGPKYGFGTDKRSRSENTSAEKAPGPGTYNVPAKFADAPKYALNSSKLKISL